MAGSTDLLNFCKYGIFVLVIILAKLIADINRCIAVAQITDPHVIIYDIRKLRFENKFFTCFKFKAFGERNRLFGTVSQSESGHLITYMRYLIGIFTVRNI